MTDTQPVKSVLRKELDDIATEFGRSDRARFVDRIVKAATQGPGLPSPARLKVLGRTSQRFGQLTRDVVERASRANKLSDEELALLVRDVGHAKLAADAINAILLDNQGGGGGSGARSCRQQYDDCINDLNCDDSDLICICCVPCSIAYARCVTRTMADDNVVIA